MASVETHNPKLVELENQVEKAEGLETAAPDQAIAIYRAIAGDGKLFASSENLINFFAANMEKTEDFIKLKESAIYKLAKLLAKKG
jgi:hypothetical protein